MTVTRAPALSERLADHVVGLRFEDIPAPVVEKAKAHLAHHFGAAFRGCQREMGQQAVQVARELATGPGRCSLIGRRETVALLDSVFANAVLMHCAGIDDFLLPPGCNPGVITNPVAWAFGEATGATGGELLVAVVVGYDLMGVLSTPELTFGLGHYRPAKHVLSPFGAAATASRLLGLSHQQTVHALGHAGQAGRNVAGDGAQAWTMHPLLARGGAMAAMLAKAGLGASPVVLDGEHGVFRTFFACDVPDAVMSGLATLGHDFAIARAQVKRAPVSALNVLPIELTQRLLDEHGLSAADVATIDLVISDERRARETKRDALVSAAGADHTSRTGSPRFWVATVVADGRFDGTRADRPLDDELAAQLAKVRMGFEAGRPLMYARVEVTTTEGRHHAAEADGHSAPPIDWPAWLAAEGGPIVPAAQLTRLTDLIADLEAVADVSEVMACAGLGARS